MTLEEAAQRLADHKRIPARSGDIGRDQIRDRDG